MSRPSGPRWSGVGTELLLGQIANTNARWIGERLAEIGVDVLYHQVVGDNLGRIARCSRLACSRADVVLVTGGLGPTEDDITRDVIADLLGAPHERDPEIETLSARSVRGVRRRGHAASTTCGRPTCPKEPGSSCPNGEPPPG